MAGEAASPGLQVLRDVLTLVAEGKDTGFDADSRVVARLFDKRHADVLRRIGALHVSRRPIIREFAKANFQHAKYADDFGRSFPMFFMTGRGLALLASALTGMDAIEFRIAMVELLGKAQAEG